MKHSWRNRRTVLAQKHVACRKRGVSLSSYGLIVGLISIVALATVTNIGDQVETLFSTVSGDLAGVLPGGVTAQTGETTTPTPSGPPTVAATTIDPGLLPTNNSPVISNGDRTVQFGGSPSSGGSALSAFATSSGRYYWEVTTTSDAWATGVGVMVDPGTPDPNSFSGGSTKWVVAYSSSGRLISDSFDTSGSFTPFNNGDVVGVALDADAGNVWICVGGSWVGGASQADVGNGLNPTYTGLSGSVRAMISDGGSPAPLFTVNFGQSSFSACGTPAGFSEGFGPPS